MVYIALVLQSFWMSNILVNELYEYCRQYPYTSFILFVITRVLVKM